mgnify:CR=1 FL=1
MMTELRYFDDVKVGNEGTTLEEKVTKEMIQTLQVPSTTTI